MEYTTADDLYRVEYTDGDAEDVDEAEYLKAVALFRKDTASSEEEAATGSDEDPSSDSKDSALAACPRKSNPKKTKPNNVSTVKSTSVAAKELATMSASAIAEVNVKLEA